MYKIKISVKNIAYFKDLSEKYENPILHACNLKINDYFISINAEKPQGFCESAWSVVYPFVKDLADGKGDFFDGWMKNPYSAMISCNDGFRPVSFYIERID